MKQLLFSGLIFCMIACTKSENDLNLTTAPEDYFLNFDIKENYFNTEENDSYEVTTFQNIDNRLIFTDAHVSHHKNGFFLRGNEQDSIEIVGSLLFESDTHFGFEEKEILFEILLKEDIKNLENLGDGTYIYKSNKVLYDQLMNNNFGKYDGSKWSHLAMILITIPPDEADLTKKYVFPTSSNGFHFSHEDINFSGILYDQRKDRIKLNGTFEIDLKQLSCGFMSSHEITNAEFQILIN